MNAREVNFDSLVGPTHNYGGLSAGNLASMSHAGFISNPKGAALQGLEKMRSVWSLGVPQAVILPHERPNIPLLRNLGFRGSDVDVLKEAYHSSPNIFIASFSSSSMWAANAATVSPSADTKDHRLHITPANLLTYFHRSQEAPTTYRILKKIFADEKKFVVHEPLPSYLPFSDEGAANHNRCVSAYGESGYEIFVYGKTFFGHDFGHHPFPARQTKEASEAVARRHQLSTKNTIFVQQNAQAIQLGVFHNDVASVMNENVFFYHEDAFENTKDFIRLLSSKINFPFYLLPVERHELDMKESVHFYLFNSQMVTLSDKTMCLIVPIECRDNPKIEAILHRVIQENNPIQSYEFVDCHQSMQNGGGPACLRLRVVLTKEEEQACLPSVFFNEQLYQRLKSCIEKHYRDRLTRDDLRDPSLLEESKAALSALSDILGFGSFYSFQQV